MRELKTKKIPGSSPDNGIRLVHRYDTRAFESIYRDYRTLVHRICLRMLRDPHEAEDATQEVFVRVYCKMHTFRGNSAFSTWLYRLTINSVLMRFRKNKYFGGSLDDYADGPGGKVESRHQLSSGFADGIDLNAAIAQLPKGYKSAFLLHDVHGYRHWEIAGILGLSAGSSKSQLHKARKRLRELLADVPKGMARRYTGLKQPATARMPAALSPDTTKQSK